MRNLEKVDRKRYEALIKDGDNIMLVSYATKEDLIDYINLLDMVCPKCHTLVDAKMFDNKKYFCKACNRMYNYGENDYHFVRWEKWMKKEKK